MFKDIEGYEGRYKINKFGQIWSYHKNGFMKTHLQKNGYEFVKLSKDGKMKNFLVHRLVLTTFDKIPNCENFDVNHKNGKRNDNNLTNLEWLSHQDNMKDVSLYATFRQDLTRLVNKVGQEEAYNLVKALADAYEYEYVSKDGDC